MCCGVKTRLALYEVVILYCIKKDKEKEQLFRIIYRGYTAHWKFGLSYFAITLKPTMEYFYKANGMKHLKKCLSYPGR